MSNKVVSIIIPIYNAEKTIDRCLNSIINQSWPYLEIILVDNGCTDETITRVSKYKDDRIKIFKQTRKGASAARNLGLIVATGEYLLFVDSDDYIERNMVKKLIEDSNNNSMIFCNTIIHENNENYITKVFEKKGNISKREAMITIVSGAGGLVCSKLISREVVNKHNIFFNEELFWSEDQLFFLEVANCTEYFRYIEEALYHYDKTNEGSATNRYQVGLVDNFLNLQEKIEEIFRRSELHTTEDKILLDNKVKRWFWDCVDNEVKDIKVSNFTDKFKNVRDVVEKVRDATSLEYLEVKGLTDRVIKRALTKKSYFEVFNVILISKILMIKNG